MNHYFKSMSCCVAGFMLLAGVALAGLQNQGQTETDKKEEAQALIDLLAKSERQGLLSLGLELLNQVAITDPSDDINSVRELVSSTVQELKSKDRAKVGRLLASVNSKFITLNHHRDYIFYNTAWSLDVIGDEIEHEQCLNDPELNTIAFVYLRNALQQLVGALDLISDAKGDSTSESLQEDLLTLHDKLEKGVKSKDKTPLLREKLAELEHVAHAMNRFSNLGDVNLTLNASIRDHCGTELGYEDGSSKVEDLSCLSGYAHDADSVLFWTLLYAYDDLTGTVYPLH